ncbi:hypothetical protein ACF0H5_012541 [Mactra antiquata]
MGDSNYIIDCCGIVDRWTANFDGTSGSHTVYFQIWRPSSGSSYELVGQNSMSVSSDGEQSISVGTANQITIKSGDRWGWWTSGTDIITYKKGGGEEDDNYMMSLSSTNVGDIVNWGSATIENDRSYAVRVDTQSNDSPTFTNLPSTVSIVAGTPSGTQLITVSVNDVNTDDISTLSVSLVTATTKYNFDSSTLIVTTSSSLGTTSSVDTLVFTVSDQCSNTATSTFTVSITNEPPEIHGLPSSNSISEDETVETLLHTINATDPEGSVTCTLASSVPSSYPFTVKMIPSTTSYGVYSDSSPGFSYNTQNQYVLTVECTDGEFTDTGTFTVYIVQNTPPVFINLQNSTSVSTTSAVGSNAFTVLVSDAENDDLIYSMTCDPSPCPFNIYNSGQIQISEDLSTHTIVGYDLNITVNDGRNTVGPSLLTITIADLNDPVVINNLPVTRVVAENTVITTSVFDVNFTDIDTSQSHSFSMSSTPTDGLTYFFIDGSSGLVSVITSPDFESLATTTFVFNVTVTDPVTSDSGLMTIQVTNVNEAPSFSQAAYSLSTTESVSGTIIGTPSFGISDPDSGDSYTLTLDCGTETGYFSMLGTTGEVSFQSNYDLDTGSVPTSVSCTVNVTDAAGLVDTAALTISIDDINDNTPIFSPTSYVFYVNYYASVGTSVGTVTATDGDIGNYGILTYTLDQSSLSAEYFSIDTSGDITVKTSLVGSPLGYASTITISSTVSDSGGLSDNSSVVITISDTTTTSTTTTTVSYLKFIDDPKNIAWLVVSVIIFTVCFVFAGYLFYTCHGQNSVSSIMKYGGRSKKARISKVNKRRRSSIYSIDDNFDTINRSVRQPPPPAGMILKILYILLVLR